MNKQHNTALVWFRRDLRLSDNPALVAACKEAENVIPIFIWAPEEEAPWQPGAASQWWLHHALDALKKECAQHHAQLIIRSIDQSTNQQGKNQQSTLQVINKLIEESAATAVYWNRLYEPSIIKRDKEIKESLKSNNIDAQSYNGALLIEPWQIATKQDNPYRVFTPFWREALKRIDFKQPLATPTIPGASAQAPAKDTLASLAISDLNLLPTIDWDSEFYEHWTPSTSGAHDELEAFIDHRIHNYNEARNIPSKTATSKLSPHLHFGTISPHQIAYRIQQFEDRSTTHNIHHECKKYLSELGWREFAHHLLFHYPETTTKPLNDKFTHFPWAKTDEKKLAAWQQGQTGIPLVDAGMRELWQTGWMHNRVRMLVGSLLVKNLRYHWSHGAEWFWDTLVDASLANNTLGWQWVAGCGADAAPYFRIFNPVTQAEKFDPQRKYIKHYVPEVESNDCPEPIVDLQESRKAALQALQDTKS